MRAFRITHNTDDRRAGAVLTALFLAVLMLLLAAQPVSAAEETAEPAPAEIITEAAFEAASNAGLAHGKVVWRVTPSGEAVKSSGGTLMMPSGDSGAEAPKIKAKGAAVYASDLGRIVYGKNDDKILEPYSTTKLLTCWLALKNLNQDDIVTVSAEATQEYENGTTIFLKEGEEISVKDLLYGAMLESGNDAAYALGEAVAGSEAQFADLMNKTVAEWGCKNTHFANANGWKDKNSYTTAHDLAIITAKCLENDELREISITKTYEAPETNMTGPREMKNYFLLVTSNPDDVTGGKTGTWDDDDCGLVASFSEGGLDAVIVLLGDTEAGRPVDIRRLMAYSHEVTPGFIVPAQGEPVEEALVKHGEKTKVALYSDGPTYAYPASNSAKDVRTEIKYEKLKAPIKKGAEVGEFLVYVDDELVGDHKLIAGEDIETGWLPSYLYISNRATLNALKVIGLFILLMLIVSTAGRRRVRKRKRTAQARRSQNPARQTSRQTGSSRSSAERPVSRNGGNYRSAGSTSGAARSSDRSSGSTSGTIRSSDRSSGSTRKEKREARKRLREKYRDKH